MIVDDIIINVMMNRKCRYVTELHMVHSILKFSDLSHSVVRKIVHLPTSIMTDHRSRFYANTSEVKKKLKLSEDL